MGSTTPLSGLPYPVGTDLVVDGDNAIRALALALDQSVARSWVVMPPFTGVGGGQSEAHRRGFMVTANINLTTTAALASGADLVACPVGYRSGPRLFGTLMNLTKSTFLYISVEPPSTGGNSIRTQMAIASGDLIRGSVTYPIDSYTASQTPADYPSLTADEDEDDDASA